MASFLTLPTELQCQILSYVPPFSDKLSNDAREVVIVDGKRTTPPLSFFLVSRGVRLLAQEMEMNTSCIIITGNPKKNQLWLVTQPGYLLKAMRNLHLVITGSQLLDMKLLDGWNQFVGTLAKTLLSEKVHLFLDASLDYDTAVVSARDCATSPQPWNLIIAPFRRPGPFEACKDFYVYWPYWGPPEHLAEAQVKGVSYDSIKRGKTAQRSRTNMISEWEMMMMMFNAEGFSLRWFDDARWK